MLYVSYRHSPFHGKLSDDDKTMIMKTMLASEKQACLAPSLLHGAQSVAAALINFTGSMLRDVSSSLLGCTMSVSFEAAGGWSVHSALNDDQVIVDDSRAVWVAEARRNVNTAFLGLH